MCPCSFFLPLLTLPYSIVPTLSMVPPSLPWTTCTIKILVWLCLVTYPGLNNTTIIIVSSAYKSLGLLRRTFKSNSTTTKRQLYLSLIRSRLTYCSPVWRPYLLKDINLLQKVQRRATKFIFDDYTSEYRSRLSSLRILP